MTLEQTLRGWTGPSSTTEQEKQVRTERMIKAAIDAHPAFKGVALSTYSKGSYPNNTNVRADSDVDIAVQCSEAEYWDEVSPASRPTGGASYTGIWTAAKLRTELVAALRTAFGNQVDTSGTTAIRVNSSTARVDADVVPCFDHVDYLAGGQRREGTKVFRKNGDDFENYPAQHLAQGRAKNARTGQKFKEAVRVLKRVENAMVVSGDHREVPSFFVECLVYNCPDHLFSAVTWEDRVRRLLFHIWDGTHGDVEPADGDRWMEVNDVKYLFHPTQAWSRKDGRDFAHAAWNYLGLA